MALTQRGIVYKLGKTQTRDYKDRTFYTREIIIEQPSYDPFTGERRNSNFIKFEATREETCDRLSSFPEGTKVEIEFICRGSLYKRKDGSGEDVFTHLEVRDIALASGAPAGSAPRGAGAIPAPAPTPASTPAPATATDAAPAPAPAWTADDFDPDLGF